jgi:hypothetical protein
MVAELDARGARRLPVHLVDDLLEIVPEQRCEDPEDAAVGAISGQGRLEIGGPLHQAHDPAELRIPAEPEQDVLMAEARVMLQAFGVDRSNASASSATSAGSKIPFTTAKPCSR